MKKTIELPELAEGETYAGLILNEDGTPSHRLIALPGEVKATFAKAKAMVVKDAKELPTRQEQALAFANCKALFQSDWYWSGEEHASGSAFAWCQYFGNGSQSTTTKGGKLRVRFFRRLPI